MAIAERDFELRRFLDFYNQENAWVAEATAVSLTMLSGGVESTFSFTGGLTTYHWQCLSPHMSPLEREVIAKGVLQAILRGRGIPVALALDAVNALAELNKRCIETCPGCEMESICRASQDYLSEPGGFTKVADDLVERIRRELAIRRKNATRRARGRPKDEESDAYLRERYAILRNALQVAREAAAKYGISDNVAYKRITRAKWYRELRPAVETQRRTPKQHLPRAAMTPTSLADRIATYLSAHSWATPHEIANALGVSVQGTEGTLWDRRDRFVCEQGDRWHLVEA